MSKKESKGRLKRRSKAYRRVMIAINVSFTLLIVAFGIYGALHTFTKKKEYRNKGVAEYNNNQYEAAIEFFDKALAENQWFSDKLDADILLFKAESEVMLKQYDEANLTYQKLKEYPSYIMEDVDLDLLIRINEAFIAFDKGDYETALPGFIEGYEADYDNLSLYAGICYENLMDYENMHVYYNYYRSTHGNDAFLCYKEATYYMMPESASEYASDTDASDTDASNYSKVLAAVTTGLELDDGEYNQQLSLVEIICLEKQNNFEEAYEKALIYVQNYPEDEEGLKLYKFLQSRVEPDTELVNPIF